MMTSMMTTDEATVQVSRSLGKVALPEAVGIYLGIEEAEVVKLFEAGKLLGLDVPDRGPVLVWGQLSEGRIIPGLDRVIEELSLTVADRREILAWFAFPSGYVDGRSWLTVLREGKVSEVMRGARAMTQIQEWATAAFQETVE